MFLLTHVCHNDKCYSFSYLKCSGCMYAHYCDEECQMEDWEEHQKDCVKQWNVQLRKMLTPINVQDELRHCFGKKIISFATFFREITYKVYEAFHGVLETGKLNWYIKRYMGDFQGHVNPKMANLLKNREGVKP